MRLIFVHGMRQEAKEPVALRAVWEGALLAAWGGLGLTPKPYELEMPFYGKVLGDLVAGVRGSGGVVARGTAGSNHPFEDQMLRDYQQALGISDDQVRAELGQEVVARGPLNWEWTQAIARTLEKIPLFGEIGLDFVVQVDGYLDRPHIGAAVDDIVRPALTKAPAVVVAHSLGTIVTYRLLTAAGAASQVPLLMTLGSPLGIAAVRKRLKPPKLARPAGVARWINGTDERDYVALHAKLDGGTFSTGIENIADIHNRRSDAHLITDYLSDPRVAQAIYDAL